MTEESNGLFGRNITTEMRKKLTWRAVYLLDLYEGLWRNPGQRVFLSNQRIAKEFNWSTSSVKRANQELVKHGYITCAYAKNNDRIIQPGGVIASNQVIAIDEQTSVENGTPLGSPVPPPRFTREPTSVQDRPDLGSTVTRPRFTGDPYKTLEYKTLEYETLEVKKKNVPTVPPRKTKNTVCTNESISQDELRAIIEHPNYGNRDIELVRYCWESMRDWSIGSGKKKANWAATLRNWIKRERKERGIDNLKPQPKTFREIEEDNFQKELKAFVEGA